MIIVRFKVQCQPDKTDLVMDAFKSVIGPSRQIDGVVSFDIGRDLEDPNSFIATEVFDDRAALERQESLPEVAATIGVLEDSLAAAPEATIFEICGSEPWAE